MFFRLLFLLLLSVPIAAQQPISLLPANPHYFLFRGKPTVLVSDSENGQAYLNPNFEYVSYLDTLQKYGFNYTRISTFSKASETEDVLVPWAKIEKSDGDGSFLYDLDTWNQAYFDHLTDFIAHAAQRGIVVEVKLFGAFSDENQWFANPFHPSGNVNIHNNFSAAEVYTPDNGELTQYQDALVAKIVEELNGFDNVFYEILDAPWSNVGSNASSGVSSNCMAWQAHIADVIMTTEASLPNKHILSQNTANSQQKIKETDPRYSIYTFHEATPEAVAQNAQLRKVIGCDQAKFRWAEQTDYLNQAWRYLLVGGGLYNRLEDSQAYLLPNCCPEALVLRKQISFLKQFIESFDFSAMQPDTIAIRANATCWVLGKKGQDYAAYIEGSNLGDLTLNLPAGKYFVIFIDIQHGEIIRSGPLKSNGTPTTVHYQHPMQDWALRVIRQ